MRYSLDIFYFPIYHLKQSPQFRTIFIIFISITIKRHLIKIKLYIFLHWTFNKKVRKTSFNQLIMRVVLFIVTLSLLFTKFVTVSKTYTCVHDELYKDYHPHTHVHQKNDQSLLVNIRGRQMAVLSRTPIRITLDTSDFNSIKPGENGASSTTNANLQYIKRAMQVAKAFFEARVQVTQVSRIYAPSNCFDFDPPTNDVQNGIASSDLHIYIQYLTDKAITYGATGVSCRVFTGTTVPDSTFQAGRPTIGRIKFNTYTLLQNQGITNAQALLTNRRFSAITATALHETIHILGFNSNLYSTYLDPRTSNGGTYTSFLSASAKLHLNRPETVLLTTPHVTDWAKKFYKCDGITGMQLQNEDATTPGSHWQRAIMYDELMTGTQLGAQKGISGATFALLKDMGWYNVDDRFYDYTNYGFEKGCDFYNKVCYNTPNDGKYFCNANTMSSISDCSTNFMGKSICTNQAALMADGCSMWAQYHHCVDPNQGDDGFKQYTLEQYGTSSFCVTSTLGTSSVSQQSKSRCYPYVCTYQPGVEAITFTIGSYSVNCLKSQVGKKKTISALAGYLQCPNYDDYCLNSRKICKNWCSQNGFCSRGICNCLPGFSGDDCSITTCISTEYYNPTTKTCAATCPSGTYQNIYSQTCLPCDSSCQQCIYEPKICVSCLSTVDNPQVKYNGVCSSKCPDFTYQVGDTCDDCDVDVAKCGNCFGQKTNCTSCQAGLYLSSPTSGTCGSTCPNPTYSLKDIQNFKCVDTCKDNLVLRTIDGVDVCTMCPLGQFKWVKDLNCHPNCEPKFYEDVPSRFCKQCHSSCLYCDGSFAENCTQCKSDSTNKYLLLKMCVSSCPSGYYANDTSGACELCTVTLNCATCYVNGGDSKIYCSTCKYGYYLQANNTCLTSCDQYKYMNRWNHSCDDCSSTCGDCSSPSESSCTNCRLNKYFLSNQTGGYCLDDCPTQYYVKTGTNCLPCHKTCKTCNGVTSSNCHSCIDGLFLYNGYCRYVCPQKSYPNKQTSKCDSCNPKCRFCFGSTVDNCTSCQANLVLNNFTCASSCPQNYTVNQWSVCVKVGFNLSTSFFFLIMLSLITYFN